MWLGMVIHYTDGNGWIIGTLPLVAVAAISFWSASPFPPDASRVGMSGFGLLVALGILGPEGPWKAAVFALVGGAFAGGGLRSNLRFYEARSI
jgi:hypothetical protein